MELSDFAKQILLWWSLDDKLWIPYTLEDERSGTDFCAPSFPGRPKELDPKTRRLRIFPKDHDLDFDSHRAAVMHFFANH